MDSEEEAQFPDWSVESHHEEVLDSEDQTAQSSEASTPTQSLQHRTEPHSEEALDSEYKAQFSDCSLDSDSDLDDSELLDVGDTDSDLGDSELLGDIEDVSETQPDDESQSLLAHHLAEVDRRLQVGMGKLYKATKVPAPIFHRSFPAETHVYIQMVKVSAWLAAVSKCSAQFPHMSTIHVVEEAGQPRCIMPVCTANLDVAKSLPSSLL